MVIHVVQYLCSLTVLCAVLPTHLDGDTMCDIQFDGVTPSI